MKYTREVLEPLVRESLSVAEILRKLGLRCLHGGTHYHVSKRIKEFGIDSSHFLGQSRNRGLSHKGGPEKLHWATVLVYDRLKGRKEFTARLRKAMIEYGIEEVCATCGMSTRWNGKKLVLQISHKDGDSLNNVENNLHFECPNCHSQTEDFGGRSAGKKAA
jgi:hypothetical protein